MADLHTTLQNALGNAFTVERELTGGGMSRVFVARDQALGREVVVKVLPPDMAAQVSSERFTREIAIAARLQHPHIVQLFSAGESGELRWFTMPFVAGESLRVRLARGEQLPLADSIRILREVASALAYAHAHDVVHRDIKPDNVLLSGDAAMVTDFGVAKAIDMAYDSPARTTAPLTSVGMALGTPAYMAPEQIAADVTADHRVDIYAWGVMAYELLAGKPPFAERSPQAMLAAHIAELPDPLAKRKPGLPTALTALVMRCLAKQAADRPHNATEIVAALDALSISGASVSSRAPLAMARPARIAAFAAVLVIVAAGAAWAWRARSTSAPAGDATQTLAVLPIETVGGDSTTEYLADGMTGELANALRKMPGLRVAGDLSTSRFKHSTLAPSEIARQLAVGMLLTGRVQPGQGRMRLQMQLSDGEGKLLWSNTYDRESKDNFAMQDSVTSAVASELRLVFSPAALTTARAGRTENPAAHDLYLRGQFEKNKLSEEGMRLSIEFFKRALALDSNYAQAHAAMSVAYDMLADGYAESYEYHRLAKEAALRAVRADSMLAAGRVMNGYEQTAANWEFAAGEAEMKRGVALDPNSPDGLFMYGTFLLVTGRESESRQMADRLLAVDPLSPVASLLKSQTFVWGGEYEKALVQDRFTRTLDPNIEYLDPILGTSYRELGRLDESVQAYERYQRMTSTPAFGLAMTYVKMGKLDDARRVMVAAEEYSTRHWLDPSFIAAGWAAMGDRDRAMHWLERAFAIKAFSIAVLARWDSPWLRPMKGDPRYEALLAKVRATRLSDDGGTTTVAAVSR